VSDKADDVLEAAIRDAKLALEVLGGFNDGWNLFVHACRTQQMDLATIYGERLVATVESAVDLYQTSHRRIGQFEKLTHDPMSPRGSRREP
jgi:hypothetical protein